MRHKSRLELLADHEAALALAELDNAKDAYRRGDPKRAARYAELASKHFEKCASYHAEDEGKR
jgi:hypothetical protein